MMNLVIDIGNTLAKMALFCDEKENPEIFKYHPLQLRDVQSLFDKYAINNSMVSNVGKCDAEIISFLQENSNFVNYSCHSKLPITIDYLHPESLGLDRIANAVGASALFPHSDILSVQAGSCIVMDFIDRNNVYYGGSISPGIDMRFKALHHFTEALPYVEKDEIDFFVGNDTQQSIKSGVINGAIYEINGFIDCYRQRFHEIKIIITGGDSEYLKNSIKNTIFATSNLVLYGLNIILKLNV